jgi:UDP:flavonoid glycosyltransferase YjiC (YdhE family)
MRVLVTSTSGLGHVLPLVPLALELRAQGHELHWLAGPDSVEEVTDLGIDVTVAGMRVADRLVELRRRHPELDTLPPTEARAVAFSTHFGELSPPAVLPALRPLVDDWQPDVIVHDAAELAAPLVAASARIPSVCQGFGEVVPEPSVKRVGDVMARAWENAGLRPDPYGGSYRGLYVDIYPPTLRSADMAHVLRVQPRRPATGQPAEGSLVYVTFGTVFNAVDDGFRAAVHGAAAVAEEVLVTVGRGGDPAGVGPVPANVRVERFVPQAEVLPRCVAVVCHGGSGTLLAALAHGVPVVCLPRAADQFRNADNVARVGAGRVLVGDGVTEPAVRAAVEAAIGSPEVRAVAQGLAEEIVGMPSDAEVAAAIERFAGTG